jgi:Kef-type K+ transport system membrane component KefB
MTSMALSFVWSSVAPAIGEAHADAIGPLLLGLTVILVAAKLGADLATRIGQPGVLGELVAGICLGNLDLLGFTRLEPLTSDAMVDMLARLGVLVLLFEVGLESTVGQMLKLGVVSFAVAVLGVVAPFALGWFVGAWWLPNSSAYVHAFLGATLCATSVGITARVFQDLGQSQSNEARVILGAAVIDDVLGLIVLAVVAGAITAADRGDSLSYVTVFTITGKAAAFLVGSLALGVWLSPKLFRMASGLQVRGVLLALGLAFCFLLSWMANAIGLAPIVGAFAAGLILEDAHYRDFVDRGEHGLEELVAPIASFLVPIFFVLMGLRTDLRAFAEPGVLGLAIVLVAVAVIGKQACSLGVIGTRLDWLTIGIGMVPRGEVGLIFANMGLALTVHGERIVDPASYSAIVVMVIVTTMLTPPALKWSIGRR